MGASSSCERSPLPDAFDPSAGACSARRFGVAAAVGAPPHDDSFG
jgi:hypothetical protein